MGDHAAYIVIQGPGHNDTRIALREGITSFGRLPSNDVILLGDLVSRNHARIIFFDGKASLQDLGSHNGSWVNEERIATRALVPGDILRIGNFKVTFLRGVAGDAIADFVDEATGTASEDATSPPSSRISRGSATPGPKGASLPPRSATHSKRPSPVPEEPGEDLHRRSAGASAIVKDIDRVRSGHDGENPATLQLLYRVTEALSRASNVRDYLEMVVSYVLERIPAELAIVLRTQPGGDPIRVYESGEAQPRSAPVLSMNVVRWTISKRFTVYSRDVKADLRFKHGQSIAELPESLRAIVCAPIGHQDRVLGALHLSRDVSDPFSEDEVDLIEAVCHLVASGLERIEERQGLVNEGVARQILGRAHAPENVERILREPRKSQLTPTECSVCFIGIQGFVAVADQLDPAEVSEFLSAYLDEMSAAVFAHQGGLHHLLGDEIVAVFGVPYPHRDDPGRAVTASLEMRSAFDRLVARRPGLGPLRLSVGIDSGVVLAGPVGATRRLDYTLLGEAVRVAARLRALAPPGSILTSASTQSQLDEQFGVRIAGKKQLRPRREPEDIFEVTGRAPESSRTELLDR
ncbi:MAG: adenylate/guanylate cyclase domain-containing protein [Myxococcota bacterium]